MTTTKQHILLRVMLATLSVLLISSCNNKEDDPSSQASPIYLLPLTHIYQDNLLGDTRALPTGFSVFHPDDVTNIDVFLTSTTGEDKRGTFSNETGAWLSDIDIENGQLFYIYGFMPKEAVNTASVAPLNGSVSNGVVMTLEGLSPLSTTDVCVIVGVKQGDSRRLPISNVEDLRQGRFDFTGKSANEGNYIYLLLNHIYASIGFQFRVDSYYNTMRTIVLKKVSLTTTSASSSTATITIKANSTGEDPIQSVSWARVAGSKEVTLYDHADGQALTSSFSDLTDCVFANLINGDITMHCTYDVYDKAGNLTRADCVTENQLPPMTITNRGERTILRLTVNPTYLYVLSDADLDNPSLTIE